MNRLGHNLPMAFPVTKFEPPARRAATVPRPHITGLLARERRQLVLISAPAGFGKTSVAAQWYAILRAEAHAAVWISLAREESDLFRLINLLVEGIQRELPTIGGYAGKILGSRADIPWQEAVASLLEDIAACARPISLFLDDYHLIETRDTNALLESLLRQAPRNLSLVITSRNAPAIGIAALKVRDVLTEVTLEELKFTLEEATLFTSTIHELNLGSEDLKVLQEKTEGWAAGLQLAALSLKKGRQAREFISSLEGNFRDISDYLFSDVLSQQDAAVQSFLLRTSILDRLSAPLCAAIMDDLPTKDMLERIEYGNLFLFTLDQSRRWYRYHHLFREFLRSRLIATEPALARRITLCAARHCALNGLAEEAVRYALAAEAFDYAASLVESHALAMIYQGEVPRLISWLQSIPEHVVASHPRLLAFRCWTLFHRGRSAELEDMLLRTEAAGVAASADGRARAVECSVLRVSILVSSDRFAQTCAVGLPLAREIQDQPFLAGVLQNFIGIASVGLADIHEARQAAREATRLLSIANCPYGVIYAGCINTLCHLTVGDLTAARRAINESHKVAQADCGNRSFCAALTACLSGVVAYHESQLEMALPLLTENLPLIRDCVHLELQRVATVALCRLYSITGDVDSAHHILDLLEQTLHTDSEGRSRILVAGERMRLLVRCGLLNHADQIWRSVGGDNSRNALIAPPAGRWSRTSGELDLLRVRWLVARGRHDESRSLMTALDSVLVGEEHRLQRREIAVLRASSLHQEGSNLPALTVLEREFGNDPSSVTPMPIREEGPALVMLWQTSQADKASRRKTPPHIASGNRAPASPGIRSNFSGREIDVLRLVAIGRKNSKIALELAISENTVKWHVRNILEKFGVTNRISAVVAARESGLIR